VTRRQFFRGIRISHWCENMPSRTMTPCQKRLLRHLASSIQQRLLSSDVRKTHLAIAGRWPREAVEKRHLASHLLGPEATNTREMAWAMAKPLVQARAWEALRYNSQEEAPVSATGASGYGVLLTVWPTNLRRICTRWCANLGLSQQCRGPLPLPGTIATVGVWCG